MKITLLKKKKDKVIKFDPKQPIQDQFALKSICFGCGPANKKGLQIKSYVKENSTICHWTPKEHHEAFPGMINGGIIGSILDCHCNWTAAWSLYRENKLAQPPCTVTAKYSIELLKPTPSGTELYLEAHIKNIEGSKVKVEAILKANNEVCAKCEGLFVAVKPGHPAYHRW